MKLPDAGGGRNRIPCGTAFASWRRWVARYIARRARPPSPAWRSFLANHADRLAWVDFFVVPTVTFKLLYAFVVLCHDRYEAPLPESG
jgi:hypothetical protein